MAYTPTTWKDHLVPYPGRYIATPNADGTYTLIEDFGTPTQEGTPISAANMNKIEQGIADAHAALDARKLITYTSLADIGLTSASFDGLTTEEQFFDTVIPKMADGSLLILVIEGNNSPINNVGRFLPGTGGSGSINGILEIVKGNNNRTSVTYQFATTSALGGAHATRYEGTYVSGNISPNRKWSGWAKVWNSATFDPDAKFDKTGGTITGNVVIDNAQLQFKDGTVTKKVIHTWGGDNNGIGVAFGGGGGTLVYGGEADTHVTANVSPTNEHAHIAADQNVYFYSGLQNGWDVRKEAIWRNDGVLMLDGKRAMTRGDDPTGFIIPFFMSERPIRVKGATANQSTFEDAEGVFGNFSMFRVLWDAKFAQGRSVYLEVEALVNGGVTAYFGVNGISGARMSTTSGTFVRIRSSALPALSGDVYLTSWISNDSDPNNWVRIAAARLVIL